jgi:DNA-binding transcriptional LysR family regulator
VHVGAGRHDPILPCRRSPQQIGKLERDLGCEVLHRHPRGVTFTPVGQALVSHAEAVTGELRSAEQTVQAMLGIQPRRLAVGAFASAGQSLVPGALAGSAAIILTSPSASPTLNHRLR